MIIHDGRRFRSVDFRRSKVVLRRAFTLIELLVVIAIIAILASILFPVFARAKEAAKRTVCLSAIRQISQATLMYETDEDDRLPDRRDVKRDLRGTATWTWPASDPRGGWAAVVLQPYVKNRDLWSCPSVSGSPMAHLPAVEQTTDAGTSRYWLWRFDHMDASAVELDNLWGKTPESSIADLQTANNPTVGQPQSVAEVELVVDPYFPKIAAVDPGLRGLAVHVGGRNRGYLDGHAKWQRDARLNL